MSRTRSGRSFLLALIPVLAVCLTAPALMGAGCDGKACEGDKESNGGASVQAVYTFSNQGELGVSLYNRNVVTGSVGGSKEETNGEVTLVETRYVTSDGYEEVATWFESELGKPTRVEESLDGEPYGAVWEKAGEDGSLTRVKIFESEADGRTAIEVTRSKT